jgi:hypothetical protein
LRRLSIAASPIASSGTRDTIALRLPSRRAPPRRCLGAAEMGIEPRALQHGLAARRREAQQQLAETQDMPGIAVHVLTPYRPPAALDSPGRWCCLLIALS